MTQEEILANLDEEEQKEYLASYHFERWDHYAKKEGLSTDELLERMSKSLTAEQIMRELRNLAFRRLTGHS